MAEPDESAQQRRCLAQVAGARHDLARKPVGQQDLDRHRAPPQRIARPVVRADPENRSASFFFLASPHLGRTYPDPPSGSSRNSHSTSGREDGQVSVSKGGNVIAPILIASVTRARASARPMSRNVTPGSPTVSRIRSTTSSIGTGTGKASFTTVPRLWSM